MMTEMDKQNQIRNSKLQMSIKPFVISREELGKSKSVDKTRKGISRVNALKQNSASCQQLPVVDQQMERNFKNSENANIANNCFLRTGGPQLKMYTNEGSRRNSIQYNIHKIPVTNWNSNKLVVTQTQSQQNWKRRQKNKQDKNQSFNIDERIQSFQKQLTILQKQNTEILIQRNSIRNKFELERAKNQQYERRLSQMDEELDRKNRVNSDKEELIKQKQRYIHQLLAINQSDKQKLAECHQHILKLSLQLQSSTTKIVNLRQSVCQNSQPSLNRIEELQRKLKEQKQQKHQTEQKYRQLLIKSSLILQQKETLEKKLSLVNYQIKDFEESEKKAVAEIRNLQKIYEQCKNDALFGRACKKQLQQLQKLKAVNNELNEKIRQLQKRRLNQIQFHQEEVRRAILNQNQKNESKIQVYKQTIDSLVKQLDELRQRKGDDQKEQQENKKVIENLQYEYEQLIIALKHEINSIDESRNKMENSYKQEIQGLLQNMRQLKQDNRYLVQKLQKSEDKRRQTKQPLWTDAEQNYRDQEVKNQQLKKIQSEKNQIKAKFDSLDIEHSKLENKLQVLQLDNQRFKMREQSYERKIKNFNDEIAGFIDDKNKMREDKMIILQELDKLKSQLIVKQSEVRELSHAISKINEEKFELEEYYQQLKQKHDDISQKKSELELDFARRETVLKNNLDCSRKAEEQLKDELKLKNIEIAGLKQIQKRIQRQSVLQREKLLTKEYQSKSEHLIEKQKRLSVLNSFLNTLTEQKSLIHRFDDEEQLLTIVGKTIRQSIEKMKLMELKNLQLEAKSIHAAKIEAQSKEISTKLQEKCEQLEALLIRMQEAHKQKLVLIKQDYDIVYSKYLKYRNMVITKQKQSRSREKLEKNNHRR